MKQITWKTIKKKISWLKPTPKNYKIAVEDGSARVDKSLEKYGFAGSMIANVDGTLINGNRRTEKLKKKHGNNYMVEVSIPSRKLTPKEVQEFAAIFDFARAGETDLAEIKKDYGTTAGFFKVWGIHMPKTAVDNLKELEKATINPRIDGGKPTKKEEQSVSKPLTLMFVGKENEQFITMAEKLYPIFKTDNVTDLSFKALQSLCKQHKIK